MLTVRAFRKACTSSTDKYVDAAVKGINASGDNCQWTEDIDETCDIAFHTSGTKPYLVGSVLNNSRQAIIDRYGWRRLVLESAFFRQHLRSPGGADSSYWRLSLGGFLDDEAIYHPPGFVADSSRWKRLKAERNIKVKPWRKNGSHVLICGQKPGDSSLRGLDTHEWVRKTVKDLRLHTDRKIVVRLHPKDRDGAQMRDLPGVSLSDPGIQRRTTIGQDLKDAWAMVTYTSLSTIDAICEGVPVFAMNSGNFAWRFVENDLGSIEEPLIFDRDPWFWGLAYCQWTTKEFESGEPWLRLREAYLERAAK